MIVLITVIIDYRYLIFGFGAASKSAISPEAKEKSLVSGEERV